MNFTSLPNTSSHQSRRTGHALALTAILCLVSSSTPAVVGYVNTPLQVGFTLIANPLNAHPNDLNAIMPNCPDGTVIYRFDTNAQAFADGVTFLSGVGWYPVSGNPADPLLTIAPGEGFLVHSPVSWVNTFVGEVMQGSLTNPIPAGFSLKASMVPQSGDLASVLGYPAVVGTTIYFWRNGEYVRRFRGFDEDDNVTWDGPTMPGVGEGFWTKETAAREWVRDFTVGRPADAAPPPTQPTPTIESYSIRDGTVTLKINKNTKRYNVQFSTDRVTWIDVAVNQTATTWRGKLPDKPVGFFQVVEP